MYSIIGGDSKTYGPVTADEVHRWIREGRADERTKVKEEGSTEWRELGTISAFFPALANVPPKISGRAGLNTVASEGSVHIGDCLRQGWQVYRQDPWRITGIIVIVFVAQFLLNSIPIAGALFAFLLNGPILGGVYFFCMQAIHGQTHGLQDVTSTIRERFLPCFLATTVSSLLAFAPLLVALIPAAGLFAASGVVMEELVKHPNLLEPIRVWVACCATGEEAYSIAILFAEAFKRLGRSRPVKVFATDDDFPVVPALTPLWSSANWFEREAFDLYGIVFDGHDDLRRILTDYGFIGHPMRKDFPVTGHVEMRYDPEQKRVIYQPVTIEPREITPRIIREDNYGGLH